MNTHSFSVSLAEKIGLKESILLQHLFFWHQKNKANDHNIFDGKVWTYNSIKAFQEIFPYMSKNEIVNSLKRMVDSGLIIEGNYNRVAFDKTKWYSLTDKCLIDFLNSEIEVLKKENDSQELIIDISDFKKPIPDSNTYIKPNSNIYILDWKNDFEIYKDSLRKSVKELLNDKEYIQQQEKFNPNVNIKLTIEKACINYWATEAGWKHKKKSRSKELDWKSTITNAISSPMNRVYIARQNQEITSDVSKKYINAETYKREGYDR